MKRLLIPLLAAWLLAACASPATRSRDLPVGQPTSIMPQQPIPSSTSAPPPENPYAPRASDGQLSRGNVYIESAQILILESYPIQVQLNLKGNLPTPCHELRAEIQAPDSENKIQIEVYSVVDPGKICIQMLQPFDANISLGSFPSGRYTVWINGERAGEFDA